MRIKRYKHKRGRPRIIYTKAEENFYKKHKKQIMEGLNYVPKNRIKSTFFGTVQEEKDVNHLKPTEAMRKTLRSREFTSEQENFYLYKKEVLDRTLKGQKQNIKRYLGMAQNTSLEVERLTKTSEGWSYSLNGKTILLRRQGTSDEGYEVLYA